VPHNFGEAADRPAIRAGDNADISGRVMPAKPVKSCSLAGSTSFDSTEIDFSGQLGSMRAD
jgi:hypothetical protein